MIQSGTIMLELSGWLGGLAQSPVDPTGTTPEDAALVLSGPKFFVALIAGVVLAFAFQLLLTNLTVATGISLIGGSSSDHDDDKKDSWSGTIHKIGTALGLVTLITVTLSLFLASLFAVKLSLLDSAGLGAIVGLVIWGAYFLLLVWASSTTAGSLIGSVINTATSGFQALLGTAAAAIGGRAASSQIVATAEAAASAVRRELTAGMDPVSLRENLEDYIQTLRPPQLDIKTIGSEFESLLNDPNLREIADSENLRHIDRQTFVDLVSSRSDLSKEEVNRIAAQLEAAWNKTVKQLPKPRNSMAELVDYLKSATSEQLLGKDFSQRLDELVGELRRNRQSQEQDQEPVSPMAQALSMGMNGLIGLVMGRTDLSDFDVEKIVGQIKKIQGQVGDQADKLAAQVGGETSVYRTVRADVENYLLNKYSWQMRRETVERDFRDVLYDPEADPGAVAAELEQINRADFAEKLQQRGVFTQERIRQISTWLDEIRLEVLNEARAAEERGRALALFREVEQYLLVTPKDEFTPEKIQLNFRSILADPDVDYAHLSTRLAQFDYEAFVRILKQRSDLTLAEVEEIINELGKARERVLLETQELQEALKAKVEAQWLKVQSYLRDTGKSELDPQAIERELKLLLDDPQAGFLLLRRRVEHFDRDTLVQLLSQRQDLSEEQVNSILDRVESIWNRVWYTPGKIADQAQAQYDRVMSAIGDYLRNTGKEELNPEGIQRDLTMLLSDPKAGSLALRSRLVAMDRDTLVKLVSQRRDLSEEQVNQVIDQVQGTLRTIAKAPRRWALRTQQQFQDFQSAIADYLRSTGKEELNPEAIRRDVQLLLHDPRAGMSSLGERLSHIDRATLVALLSQRDDISEPEVNQIIDQIQAVRDQAIAQVRSVQHRIESIIDSIFDRIRNYLNSLERPELNYDGIKADIRQLFDDPQAGFDSLRDRLSQFDRNTLVALLSSRSDISEADANRLVDQIERTRNSILQRAERLQRDAQLRLEAVKHQAMRQAEETRKAAATASWWLFFTALVSAIASAGGGAIGVID